MNQSEHIKTGCGPDENTNGWETSYCKKCGEATGPVDRSLTMEECFEKVLVTWCCYNEKCEDYSAHQPGVTMGAPLGGVVPKGMLERSAIEIWPQRKKRVLVERSLCFHIFVVGLIFGGLIGMIIGLNWEKIVPVLVGVLN